MFKTLKDLILTGLRSSQQGRPPPLGNLFLSLSFGFHSLGQKFSTFCSPLPVCLQYVDICAAAHVSNKRLDLGDFAPGFLTFFAYGLSNILVGIFFYRETEKVLDSSTSFGSQTTRHGSICLPWNTFFSVFTINNLRTPTLASTTDLCSPLQFSLVYIKSAPHSTAGSTHLAS